MATTTTKRTSAKSSTTKTMDAVTLLKHDHDEVKKMFAQFEKSKASAKQQQLAQQVCMELTIHARIEEQSFYPEIKSLPKMEDMVLESLEEHRQVKELVARIQQLGAGDEHLEPDMKVLKEDIEHHIQEEEKDMFPPVKKELGKERLQELGEVMMRQKKMMKTQMQGERRVTEEAREPSHARR